MRGKADDERPFEILAYPDGQTFEFFFEQFTQNKTITAEMMEFDVVCSSILDEFEEKEEAHEVTWVAMAAFLYASNLWDLLTPWTRYLESLVSTPKQSLGCI